MATIESETPEIVAAVVNLVGKRIRIHFILKFYRFRFRLAIGFVNEEVNCV